MMRDWKGNTKKFFITFWVNCIDEIMCMWSKKWMCLGWILYLFKPHHFLNWYHSILCGLSRIIFYIELVEGGVIIGIYLLINMIIFGRNQVCFFICVIIFIQWGGGDS